MLRSEQIRNFVTLLSSIKDKVIEDRDSLKRNIQSLNSALERYSFSCTHLQAAQNLNRKISILQHKQKDVVPTESRCNIHDIADDTKDLIDSVVDEVKAIGLPSHKDNLEKSVSVTTNVSQKQEQHQNQQQDIVVNILLEAVKDELTGKQRKEILEIVKGKTSEEARKGIFERIKGYGSDVSASIVANLLTNPNVWKALNSLL